MPDYSKGKIYTLRCRTDDVLIYVGSTIQRLCERIACHKRDSKAERSKNSLLYRTINNDWDNWYIELHEECPCENKEQLCKREGEVIRLIGTLNSKIESRTNKEWYNENKDKKKQYYEDNKEKITEQKKEYYEKNKEKNKILY